MVLVYGQANMMKAYETVRAELEKFQVKEVHLDQKDEIILLTKTDTVSEEVVEATLKKFKKLGKPVFAVTLFDDTTVKDFSDELIRFLKKE